MPLSIFLVPMVQLTPSLAEAKYASGDPSIGRVGRIWFGVTDDCILLIEAAQTYLDTIAADPACTLLATPATLDNPLTAAQVTAVQNFLENRGIPADWLAAGETRRQALRGIAGMFLFSQRMEGLYGASWKQQLAASGVTLASAWQTLPSTLQQALLDTATSFGWVVQTPSPTTTLRQILKAMGNRFEATDTIILGGIAL